MSAETPETPEPSFNDLIRSQLAAQRPDYGWVFEGSKRPADNAETESPDSTGGDK